MRFGDFSFGSLTVDGRAYGFDLILDRGEISKRRKKASKQYRSEYGHTPLSAAEKLPWKCKQLVIGTGAEGGLPVMDEVRAEAERRGVRLVVKPTAEAIAILNQHPKDTNAVLHVTC